MRWIGQITYDEVSYFREDVIIEADNKLGIGTFSPSEKLHVVGDALITGDSLADAFKPAAAGEPIKFKNFGSTELARITDAGNVGIGTTSPTSPLDIHGESISTNRYYLKTFTSTGQPVISIYNANSDTTPVPRILGANSFINMYNGITIRKTAGSGNILTVSDVSNVEKLIVDTSGKVGIGTSSPSEALDVAGNIKLNGNGNQLRDYNGNNIIGNASNTLTIGSAAINTTYIRGNVGIGTTSPTHALQIEDGFTLSAIGFLGTSLKLGNYNSIGYNRIWGDGTNMVYSNNSGYHKWMNQATELMRITSAGKVGIGTTNPSQLFEINGGSGQLITTNSHQRLFITSSPLHQSILYFGDTSSNSQGRVAYDNNYDDMYFNTAGAEKMRIKSNGNVGIGTSSPTQALHLTDSKQIALGTGADLKIQHNGTNSEIGNFTGSLNIYTHTDDGDINFMADDGSGGITTYFFLDGSANGANPATVFPDNSSLIFGTGNDLYLRHTGTNSEIKNYVGDLIIANNANDKDIIFQSDDGSGGIETYLFLDGSSADANYNYTVFPDLSVAAFGNDKDLRLFHSSTNSYIQNLVGDLYIQNQANDKDVILLSDDGSGGHTAYLTLDGSATTINVAKSMVFADNAAAYFGAGLDLEINSNGSSSSITGRVGDLTISCSTDDGDIIFKNDDGSGGTTAYLTLDGSAGYTTAQKQIRFADSVEAQFGGIADLTISHDATNSIIANNTGNLQIKNRADDKDIIFECDDGSGGTTAYLTLDGSATRIYVEQNMQFSDNSQLRLGTGSDFNLYHTGTGSVIQNSVGNLTIQQDQNDGDIVFRGDNGSGGTTAYLTLDGGFSVPYVALEDSAILALGTHKDFLITHDGTDSKIDNMNTGDIKIRNFADDADVIFQSDNGAGGVATYFSLDGSLADGTYNYTKWPDYSIACFGSSNDLCIWHDSSNSYIRQVGTGDLIIENITNDKDIILKSDNGSGGTTEYFRLDGGLSSPYTVFPDNSTLTIGTGFDLKMYHNGSNSYIDQTGTGNLYIRNTQEDGLIYMQSNYNGSVSSFFYLHGAYSSNNPYTIFPDNSIAAFGSSADLQIYHDGSNSYIKDGGTGNLRIAGQSVDILNPDANEFKARFKDNAEVELYYDNALKLSTTNTGIDVTGEVKGDSLDIDGNADISGDITSASWRGDRITTAYQYQRQTFDFKGYSTHDGTNYEIPQAMTDTNAPFEHNTSVGSAGTTAISVSLLLRAGGQVMPYAGTIKKWTGWAAGSGSGTINLALFKYSPDTGNSNAQSLVLIDDQVLTAAGAQTVATIEQTSFTDGDIAAGDIIMTGIKGVSGKTTYFTSTMEIEWD